MTRGTIWLTVVLPDGRERTELLSPNDSMRITDDDNHVCVLEVVAERQGVPHARLVLPPARTVPVGFDEDDLTTLDVAMKHADLQGDHDELARVRAKIAARLPCDEGT